MSHHSDPKSLSAEEIFDLRLDDKPADANFSAGLAPQRRQSTAPRPSDHPAVHPHAAAATVHRPSRSQEEALRARKLQPGTAGPHTSESPNRRFQPQQQQQPSQQRRPRRNSESSVMDLNLGPLTQDEMKMIETKRLRDRQRRDREGRPPGREVREAKVRSKSGRPSRKLDIIDQLDATSIYGTGLFHHDGPFDALNPHRNRNSSRRAPMQAFPKDSLNNSIGDSDPLNSNPDHAIFMGNGTDEAFRDYAGRTPKNKNDYNYPTLSHADPPIFDPVARGNVVHGDQTVGLGTSTFLEGTPAARAAIARREAEQANDTSDPAAAGIQRKKSLAQRIRHIKGQREYGPSGRLTNPDGVSAKRSPDYVPVAGHPAAADANPFFAEYAKGDESITLRPRDGANSPGSPPSAAATARGGVPRRASGPSERRATTDATAATPSVEDAPPKPSGGFIGRMRSLKGGKRSPRNADVGPVS